jgi:triacylglycerol esterase/lipase EstA (alpha/beta hydrolase family)
MWMIAAAAVTLAALMTGPMVTAIDRARGAGPSEGPFVDQSRPGPVLLVPGYGGRTGALNVLAGRLRAAGRSATVILPPGDGTGDLVAQAHALDAAATPAITDGTPSVDVIGYSAGGVVVRIWVDRFAGAHKARRIITLGSPLHGAFIAGAAAVLVSSMCPVACKQLAPFSDLLRDLNSSRIPPQLPWLSIWSRNDNTVTPPSSARLPGAVNILAQSVCPQEVISHSNLPTDPLVIGIILTDLAALTPPPAPVSSSCARLRALGASL